MDTFLMLIWAFLTFICFPVSIILIIIRLIKKKKVKINVIITLEIIFLSIFITILGSFFADESTDNIEIEQEETIEEDNGKNTEEKNDKLKEEKKEEKKKSKEDVFLSKSIEYLGENKSKKLLEVLKNDIGFKEVSFINKIGETLNYNIKADGYELVVTDVGDDFRIFIPDSSYVFYEDSKVILTKKKFKDKIVTSDEASVYYIMAQDIITSCLKDPGSADFPSLNFSPEDIGFKKNGDLVLVQSYVDANNSFGATVRSKWEVQFEVLNMNTYSYDLKYINFDGEKSGSYIDMD